eukprot:Nk52_evm11s282 gene=Nk52_evmTU11s282
MKQQAFISLFFVLLMSMCILSCFAKSIKKDVYLPLPKYPNVPGSLMLKLKPEQVEPTKRLFNERFVSKEDALPKNYDPREKYPQCFHVYNQRVCGSCWANAVAGALSDRICLASKGKNATQISAADIMSGVTSMISIGSALSPSSSTVFTHNDASCSTGGWALWGWGYVQVFGAVSGGNDGSQKGCVPYPISKGIDCANDYDGRILHPNSQRGGCGPKGCPEKNCPKSIAYTSCTNKNYNTSYEDDKHYVTFVGAVDIPQMVENSTNTYEHYLDLVKREIYVNGSVSFGMSVPKDFTKFDFSEGQVYTKEHFLTLKEPRIGGGHAMRIVGWGEKEQDGKMVKYWLIANSWGTEVEDKGYLRIELGVNLADAETRITWGNL